MRLYLALVLVMSFLLAHCSPHSVEAIALKTRKIKSRPGIRTATDAPVRCGNYVCESGENQASCNRDCFTNTYSGLANGTDEYYNCPDPWSGNYTRLSVAFWVQPVAVGTSEPLVTKTTAREFIISMGAADSSTVRFSQSTSSSNWCQSATGRLVNGTWTHVVAVWDGVPSTAVCKIYINGVDDTTTINGTIQNSITDGSAALQIAGQSATGLFSSVGMDEVAIWRNRALTAAEAADIYNAGTPKALWHLEPLHWYRMGDDAGDEFDVTATEALIDQMGRVNCTPILTEGTDKQAVVPP